MSKLTSIALQWAAVERLLDVALALPVAQRAAWLAALDGEDARHRQTLQDLLRTQSAIENNDFLAELPQLPQLPLAARVAPAANEPQAGDRVGSYRLLRELGRGGMGQVWLAERSDGLAARRCALKLPHLSWGGHFAERLAREREILAALEHAHIARLYDVGIDEQGRPYIAMQFVEGQALDAYCQGHGLGLRARIELLLQVMAAVAHAHARLVVHRDIKPANILVDATGHATLLDFGVAKLMQDERTQATALTQGSGRALTPDYASPEQIAGQALGTASDIYSLGVVAYELLAGARPYRLGRGSAAELEEAIVRADAPLASQTAAAPALKKALRGDLDAILNCALKKDPAARYPTVDAFAQDLRHYLQGEPVQARPDSAGYRLRRFVGRYRLVVGMGTALALSVLAGSALSLWQAQQARAQEQRATSEVRRQRAVQDLYIETLSRLAVLGGDNPQRLAQPGAVSSVLLDKLNELAPRVAQQPDERGAQLEAVMLQLNFDNRFEESLAVGQQYLAHLKAHGGGPVQVIKTYATLGRTLFQLGRFGDSEAMRRAGMAWAPDAHDADTERIRLTVVTDLGGLLIGRGRRAEALQTLTQADAAAQRYFADEHLRFDTLTRLATFHLGFDDALALQLMRQAKAELQLYAAADGDERSQVDWQLGDALLANGLVAQAEASHGDALALFRQDNRRDSRNALRAFGRLVGAVARSDPPRALAMLDAEQQWLAARPGGLTPQAARLLDARRLEAAWLSGDLAAAGAALALETAPLLAPAALRDNELLLISLSRTLTLAGRAEQALPLLQTLRAQWPGGAQATVAWLRIELAVAQTQLAAGQAAAAGQTARQLLALLDGALGQRSRSYQVALAIAAAAAAQQGDAAAATALLQRLAQQVPVPFPSPAEKADCELPRAQALAALGRKGEAATLAQGVLAELKSQHPQSPRLALARALAGV